MTPPALSVCSIGTTRNCSAPIGLRRICKGKSPFVADAEHIHHKLLHAGFSQKKTVLILTSVAIIAGAIASLLMGPNTIKHYAVYILVIIFIMLLLNFIKVLTKK